MFTGKLDGISRAEAKSLIDNGCDLIVIDTAHGHSKKVLKILSKLKKINDSEITIKI